jgi:hypothetical protein
MSVFCSSPSPFLQNRCEKYNLKIVNIFLLLLLSRHLYLSQSTLSTTHLLSKAHKISKYRLAAEKKTAKNYGFSEFLDFPERVQRQFYTNYVEKS